MTVLRKINKNCCQQSYTFQYAQIGAYSAPPVPLAVFRGLPLGEGRGGEGGNSSYALERKKKTRRLWLLKIFLFIVFHITACDCCYQARWQARHWSVKEWNACVQTEWLTIISSSPPTSTFSPRQTLTLCYLLCFVVIKNITRVPCTVWKLHKYTDI